MTPGELYRYDLKGFLYVENAIEPGLLKRLSERMDVWQEKGRQLLETYAKATSPPKVGWNTRVGWDPATSAIRPLVDFYDIVSRDEEGAFVDLVVNPRILPYIDEMVQNPRLKSTWIAFKWRGGMTVGHSNHTPTNTCNFYHFSGGRIYHNLFNLIYAISDVKLGGGGLKLIPGSHKANYPLPPEKDREDLLVEMTMKAGSVLMFSHDAYHTSLNTMDEVRRVILYTYCPGVIANAWNESGDTMHDRLFEEAPEGSWRKYLLRRPNGASESYPKPKDRPYEAG